jgi:hypothetical protein
MIILGGASGTFVSREMSSLGPNLYIIEETANSALLTASDSPVIYSIINQEYSKIKSIVKELVLKCQRKIKI